MVAASILLPLGCGVDGSESTDEAAATRAQDTEIRAAVASNFARAHEALAEAFTAETGIRVRTSLGSTGGLLARIRNGAPYDVFLAADRRRPRRLVREGLAEPGSRFTYAEGRLALLGPALAPLDGLSETLTDDRVRHVAVADPEVAPYGAAAVEVLRRTGVYAELADRLVRAESVSQAYQHVISGAAQLGFVSTGHVDAGLDSGHLPVDPSLHAPIHQDAVLLSGAEASEPGRRFLAFLRSERAGEVLERFGYRPSAAQAPASVETRP